jgi:hypothetical protein
MESKEGSTAKEQRHRHRLEKHDDESEGVMPLKPACESRSVARLE